MSTLKRASRLVRKESSAQLANMQAVRASTRKNTKITLTQYSAAQPRSTSTTIEAAEVAGVSSLRPARLPSNAGNMTTTSYSSLCGASGRILVGARLDTWCGGGSGGSGGSGRRRGSSLTARSSVPMGGASMIGPGAGEIVTSMGVVSMQRQGMSSTTMSEQEFHSVADEALEEIHDAVEEALEEGFEDDFDCTMSQGVLNIIVGDRGTWVLNKQSPNRQIWWSSPISGPMRFEYHEESKRWLNTRDGETELRVLLATEMGEKCGVSV
ncbi:unnamed protein product [Ectocarpus sp. CCAP 1310/34]|nr:unnamed protein product [Ectocarpus sp. CCAP 1310/34]